MKNYAVIVAGGSGSRFGSAVPKQFVPMCGKPVLMHTIAKFGSVSDTSIILVIPQAHFRWWQELCEEHNFAIPHKVVAGGSSRFQSVKNALATIVNAEAGDIVSVHDGVRPLVSVELIARAFEQARKQGSAIPVVPVTDSVRKVSGSQSEALERSALRAVQTPQVFDARLLLSAYDTEFSEFFTDDASVVETAGHSVSLIDGETTNIKITHPIDLIVAEYIVKRDE